MIYIGGLIFALLCVFGSFVASGGAIGPLLSAMPFELLTILGAAIGVFVMSNSIAEVKSSIRYFLLVLKGPKFRRPQYIEILALMSEISKRASKGVSSLENDYEAPQESDLFKKYPGILNNHRATMFICDYLRMMSLDFTDPHEVSDVMDKELKKNLSEDLHIAHSLQSISDALPALGIVAAVLGVVKTMAAINQPPAILGEMIGGALVGTFLGVLLAYAVVAPLSSRMSSIVREDDHFYRVIAAILVAIAQKQNSQICVELGRKSVPEPYMPEFNELEEALRELN